MKNYNFVEILQNLRRINNLLEVKMSPKEYNKDIQKYSDRCLMGFEFEVCFPNEVFINLNKQKNDDEIKEIKNKNNINIKEFKKRFSIKNCRGAINVSKTLKKENYDVNELPDFLEIFGYKCNFSEHDRYEKSVYYHFKDDLFNTLYITSNSITIYPKNNIFGNFLLIKILIDYINHERIEDNRIYFYVELGERYNELNLDEFIHLLEIDKKYNIYKILFLKNNKFSNVFDSEETKNFNLEKMLEKKFNIKLQEVKRDGSIKLYKDEQKEIIEKIDYSDNYVNYLNNIKDQNKDEYNFLVMLLNLDVSNNDKKNIINKFHPCEIVTKPVPVLEAFKQLDQITNYLNEIGAETNWSTGLHVGVSFKDSPKLDFLKLVMFSGENYVLQQFSREMNKYAQSHNSYLQKLFYKEDSNDIQSIINFFNKNLNFEKYRFSNLSKYKLNPPYIEFRAMGGDYLNQLEKVKETAGRFVRIFGIASDPDALQEEYYKKVWKLFEKINDSNKEINIDEILKLHKEWLMSNKSSGRRLDIKNYNTNFLKGADLMGANLIGADLTGADLEGVNLTDVILYLADLQGANLQDADLYGADLEGANLTRANLEGANLKGARLFDANLEGANLKGVNLEGVNLTRANLEGANLKGARLFGANLANCKINENTKGISEELIQRFAIIVVNN